MEILYHGHSCVQITNNGISFIIDPFLSGNPVAVTKAEDVRVQYVLLTHGHGDHIADAAEIAKRNDATIIATYELATYMEWQGAKAVGINLGGSVALEFGRVKMTHAFHSSSIDFSDQQKIVYLGMPGGFLIETGGKTLYHAGDTGLFGDMKLIGERNRIDLAFLPIGDHFTMGPEDALVAAEWLGAKQVVPIHYNTFPPIKQDGEAFAAKLAEKGIGGIVMKPGETITL
ncbi:metal-dependent hydrolase [Brevibacillus sp. SYP-B805]|uniref:metal-dependent hydrolase n=1 Tax=Brevibacillus sp. SYP-B805 TaxID=1578199 RepID=UPI0013EE3EE8|nr:metal-dependent hydrolase [Brevibacillus sp. SYP-B805]NGQ95927.1 metal-dependent hydrolase [Brevibacillus sp. SYP-B805]